MDKAIIKGLVVIGVLCAGSLLLPGIIGEPWWHGLVLLAALVFIAAPLRWWIDK